MANTEIDSLSLNISINGLSDKDIKNLESLSNSIAKLQRSLRKLEISKLLDLKIPTSLKDITGVEYQLIPTKEMENFEETFKDVEETFSSFDTSSLQEAEKLIGKISTDVPKIKADASETLDDLDSKKPEKKLKSTKEQLSAMEKTLKRIKLISFIKLIRGAINSFIQGIRQGINNLASFDSSFNDTMSKITTARTQIYNSLALMMAPIIQILEPLITSVSTSMIDIANAMSMITAQIKGASTYTKLNVDYMNDYAKALQKAQGFSFDTFNAINTEDNMFETGIVDEKEIEKDKELYDIVSSVLEIFESLRDFAMDFFEEFKKFIVENKDNVKQLLQTSLEFTKTLLDTGKLSFFEKLLLSIAGVFEFLVQNADSFFDMFEALTMSLKPLVMVFGNKAVVNILRLILMLLEPINVILESIIYPIIEVIVDLLSDILTPVVSVIGDILGQILITLKPIFDFIKLIVRTVGDVIIGAIKAIFSLLQPILTLLQEFSSIFEGITEMIEGIFTLDWDKFFDGFTKVMFRVMLGIARFFASIIDGIVNFFMEIVNAIIGNEAIKQAFKVIGVNYQGITWRSNLAGQIPSYANGGIVGEVWQMNEYGNPEMLYNANNSGNTSVINVEQLSEAFERAIYNSGIITSLEEGKYIYIDGKYVAQSKNFKNELNRTNPSLNIK